MVQGNLADNTFWVSLPKLIEKNICLKNNVKISHLLHAKLSELVDQKLENLEKSNVTIYGLQNEALFASLPAGHCFSTLEKNKSYMVLPNSFTIRMMQKLKTSTYSSRKMGQAAGKKIHDF